MFNLYRLSAMINVYLKIKDGNLIQSQTESNGLGFSETDEPIRGPKYAPHEELGKHEGGGFGSMFGMGYSTKFYRSVVDKYIDIDWEQMEDVSNDEMVDHENEVFSLSDSQDEY